MKMGKNLSTDIRVMFDTSQDRVRYCRRPGPGRMWITSYKMTERTTHARPWHGPDIPLQWRFTLVLLQRTRPNENRYLFSDVINTFEAVKENYFEFGIYVKNREVLKHMIWANKHWIYIYNVHTIIRIWYHRSILVVLKISAAVKCALLPLLCALHYVPCAPGYVSNGEEG